MRDKILLYYSIHASSIGDILIASTSRGIRSIMVSQNITKLLKELKLRFKSHVLIGDNNKLKEHMDKIIALINNPQDKIPIPLDIQGTEFQQNVWKALLNIPCGETRTYTEIAEQIGSPKAVRAVANACGANKLAIVIPCHRVIAKDGSIGGYHWGAHIKKELLKREGVIV